MSNQTNDTENNGPRDTMDKELRDIINIIDGLPASVMVSTITDRVGPYSYPNQLQDFLYDRGDEDDADKIIENMGKPGFWKALVHWYFPRVVVLPAFIEAKLRSGAYQHHTPQEYTHTDYLRLPPSEPVLPIDQAWRATMEYILLTMQNVTVAVHTRRKKRSEGKWEPPLRIGSGTKSTFLTYTLTPYTITHEHHARVVGEIPFIFKIDFVDPSTKDPIEYAQDSPEEYAKLHVGFLGETGLPSVEDFGKDVESESPTVGEMIHGTNGGALVFEGNFYAQFPFNDVIALRYKIRWTTAGSVNAGRIVVPHVHANIRTSLRLQPRRISSHTLHAIGLRNEKEFFVERLPLKIELYSGYRDPPHKLRTIKLIVHNNMDIFESPYTTHGPYSQDYSIVSYIIKNVEAMKKTGSVDRSWANKLIGLIGSRDYTLEIPYEWKSDGSYETITFPEIAPPVVTVPHLSNIRHMFIGEIIGPPRPYRPILSTEPHYEWFTGEQRGPEYIIIKMVTPAKQLKVNK